jgi:predicted RNA-binding Zn-ribbon protein involved in translation (DUF1610 family)
MKFQYDTYCGLNCGACYVLVANQKDEVEKMAKEWKLKPEDIKCFGCKTETNAIYCVDCDIKHCAEDKKVEFCFECNEYPCHKITAFRNDEHSHHSIVLKNLKTIQQQGVQKWLAEQKKRWSCSNCGERFCWYDKTCKKCGSKLYNCQDEEKDLKD